MTINDKLVNDRRMKIEVTHNGVLVYRPRELDGPNGLSTALRMMQQDKDEGIDATFRPDDNSWLESHKDWALEMCGVQKDDLPF